MRELIPSSYSAIVDTDVLTTCGSHQQSEKELCSFSSWYQILGTTDNIIIKSHIDLTDQSGK